MDWAALFQALPDIVKLVVPGYIFLSLYNFFQGRKSDGFEGTVFTSLLISYLFRLPVELLASVVSISDAEASMISVAAAAVVALVFSLFRRKGFAKKAIKKIGKITGSKSVWIDVFDRDKGSRIRGFARFNHEDAVIEGDVKYYSDCEDGECSLVLVNYVITYPATHKTYDSGDFDIEENQNAPMLCLNTRDIQGLEVVNGQAREK